jgi:hypothetical protein
MRMRHPESEAMALDIQNYLPFVNMFMVAKNKTRWDISFNFPKGINFRNSRFYLGIF